jgi:hypothetical protein
MHPVNANHSSGLRANEGEIGYYGIQGRIKKLIEVVDI